MLSHSCPASPNLQRKSLHRQKGLTDLCSHSFSSLQLAVANDPRSENVTIVDDFHVKEVQDQDSSSLVHSSVTDNERSTKSTELPSSLARFHSKVSNQDEGYLSREVSNASLNSLGHTTSRVSLRSSSGSSRGQLLSWSDLGSTKRDVGHLSSPVTDTDTKPQKCAVKPACVQPDSSTIHHLPLEITNRTVETMMKRLDILEEEVKQLQSSNDVQADSPLASNMFPRKRMSCCFPSPSPTLVPKQRKLSGTARVLRRMEKVDEESEHASKTHGTVVRNPWLTPEKRSKSIDVFIKAAPKKHRMRRCISDVVKGQYYEKEDAPFVELQTSISHVARTAVRTIQSQLGWAIGDDEEAKGNSQNLSLETTPPENEIRVVVKKHCKDFVRHMNWVTILPTLESENLLDSHSAEFLMNMNTTSQLKGNFFFLSLLPSNGPDAYTRFYKCLADEHVHEHAGHKFLFDLFQAPM